MTECLVLSATKYSKIIPINTSKYQNGNKTVFCLVLYSINSSLNDSRVWRESALILKKRPCYFTLDCMWTCSEWQDHSKQANNICTIVKKRNCSSYLLGETRIEYNNTEVGKYCFRLILSNSLRQVDPTNPNICHLRYRRDWKAVYRHKIFGFFVEKGNSR